MRRRELIIGMGGAVLAIPAAWALAACGGGDDDDVDASSGDPADAAASADAEAIIDAEPPADADPAAPDAAPTADAAPSLCVSNGAEDSSISGNHGHSLSISAADVIAGTEKSYDIQGLGNHPHTLIVSAADFTMLQGGDPVTITSSNDGHSHVVTISCVA